MDSFNSNQNQNHDFSRNNKNLKFKTLNYYNFLPKSFPNNLTNPSLYVGKSIKPIPLELSLPQRWQRGAQFLAITLSISCGIWGVLFADFGNGDREIVFSPIRRWFSPYKDMIFTLDETEKKS